VAQAYVQASSISLVEQRHAAALLDNRDPTTAAAITTTGTGAGTTTGTTTGTGTRTRTTRTQRNLAQDTGGIESLRGGRDC